MGAADGSEADRGRGRRRRSRAAAAARPPSRRRGTAGARYAADGRDDLDVTLSWPGAGRRIGRAGIDELGDDHVAAVPAARRHPRRPRRRSTATTVLAAVPLAPDDRGPGRRPRGAAADDRHAGRLAGGDDERVPVGGHGSHRRVRRRVTSSGRQGEQNLDDYRRSTERTVAELRRGRRRARRVAAPGDALASRSSAPTWRRSSTSSGCSVSQAARPPRRRERSTPLRVRRPGAGRGARCGPARPDYLRGMIDVVVDTMPASTEGSAAPVLADDQLDRVVDRLAPPPAVRRHRRHRAKPAPAPAARAGTDGDELDEAQSKASSKAATPTPPTAPSSSTKKR